METSFPENSRRHFLGSFGTVFATLGLPASPSAAHAATASAGNTIPKKKIASPYIYGFHLPWPGLGVVIPNGRKGYQGVPSSHRWDF